MRTENVFLCSICSNSYKGINCLKNALLMTVFVLLHVSWVQDVVAAQEGKTEPVLSELAKKQLTAYQNRGSDYKPRTEHFNSDGSPKYINRLIFEESPYLIQHAHNPVDWYAWGTEAFEKARRENKPIFLSIGYSTCHWCHVMERESFDNENIADYLNKHFVAIKVDRERRPDVDKIYMTALMLLKGSGGWPMSSVLTPQGKPFFSGTYLPPESFLQVLQRVTELWQREEQQLRAIGDKVSAAVQNRQRGLKQAEHIGRERVQIAVITILNRYDELQGGFSTAPKFPNETYLFLLLDTVIREQDQETLDALHLTMNMMAQGGIYDQVGGGFHRYSTDNEWLVPHFEKMLYNQAHLGRSYLQLYEITREKAFKRVVTQTLDYVLRDMLDENGGFYSASDADSEGEEGKFFLWSVEELEQGLNPALAKLAIALYGVTKEGNFSEQTGSETAETGNPGTSILHLPDSIAEFAGVNKLELNQLYLDVDSIRETLYQQRNKRIAPTIDRKIVTAWNGMMITTLARAGKQLDRPVYLNAARKAGDYLWQTHHFQKQTSGLWRASLNGRASVAAIQADYAYLAQGYLALFDATQEKQWLERSQQLTKEMIQLFWDKEDGAFYMGVQDQDVPLFDRPKDIYDAAIPSANAIALEVLAQLYHRTGNDYYHVKAMALIASLSSRIKTSPASFAYFLMAVNQLNFGELLSIQYGGKGHVRIEQKIHSQESHRIELDIHFTIDKNWHINSRYPLDEDLVATSVSLDKKVKEQWKIIRAEYPQGEKVTLKFNDSPLSLYKNTATIKLVLESVGTSDRKGNASQPVALPLHIAYQSCSDKVCLTPESKTFYLFPEK
ncbi:MAG: DUF255 domain-containing protein [Gammaproteobacteria bacterium]|nr:DUF255 domain-containing protein [Gammaproteobacteria bacterium]